MVTWGLVLETLVKWGIPILAAGIMAIVVKYIIDPQKKAYQRGQALITQEAWDALAKNSKVLDTRCNAQIEHMNAAIDAKFTDAEAKSLATDQAILAAVQDLQASIKNIQKTLAENQEATKLLQKGVVELHLKNLTELCSVWINRGYITPIELMSYNEKLKLYHDLGGNGDMEPWDARVRELPLHEHNVKI